MALSDWNIGGKDTQDPPWPRTEENKPIPPAYLRHLRSTDMEAEIVINLLTAAEIPVVTQYPNGGAFGKVILGFSGTGIDIYVPVTRLEEAKELLDSEASFEESDSEDEQNHL